MTLFNKTIWHYPIRQHDTIQYDNMTLSNKTTWHYPIRQHDTIQ